MTRDIIIATAELSLESTDFAPGQIFRAPTDIRVELAQFVPLLDTFVPYVWAEAEVPAAFEAHVRADERVASLTALDTDGTRTLYKVDWAIPGDAVMASVATHDLVIAEAMGTENADAVGYWCAACGILFERSCAEIAYSSCARCGATSFRDLPVAGPDGPARSSSGEGGSFGCRPS